MIALLLLAALPQMQQITSDAPTGQIEECVAKAFRPIALPSTVQGEGRRTMYFAQTGPSVTIIEGTRRTLEFKAKLGGFWIKRLQRCANPHPPANQ